MNNSLKSNPRKKTRKSRSIPICKEIYANYNEIDITLYSNSDLNDICKLKKLHRNKRVSKLVSPKQQPAKYKVNAEQGDQHAAINEPLKHKISPRNM